VASANPINNIWKDSGTIDFSEFPTLVQIIHRFDFISVFREITNEEELREYLRKREEIAKKIQSESFDSIEEFLRKYIIHRKSKQIGAPAFSNTDTVYEYFRLVKNKDINRLLDLFADDAIIYEPFSNIQEGLRGKSAIKPFLEIVLMANDGLQHKIEFEQQNQQQQKIPITRSQH